MLTKGTETIESLFLGYIQIEKVYLGLIEVFTAETPIEEDSYILAKTNVALASSNQNNFTYTNTKKILEDNLNNTTN